MKYLRAIVLIVLILAGCQTNGAGLKLAPGWSYQSLSAWKAITPNKMALSSGKDWLYISGERSQYSSEAGVIAIRLSSSRTHILVQGMRNANGIRLAPDGSLWIAEDDPKGVVWRMAEPDQFPSDQRVDPVELTSSYVSLAPFNSAGQFHHRAIAFSADGRFAYLADASAAGSLFRLELKSRTLAVYHSEKGWLAVNPDEATGSALTLGARAFAGIHDIERLPDGTLLLAESGSGHILQLHDDGKRPRIEPWLDNPSLSHPDDMSWDSARHWLWITDHGEQSVVWAWDGRKLHEIMRHPTSRFGGVLATDDAVYVNLQRGRYNPAMTLRLHEKHNTGSEDHA